MPEQDAEGGAPDGHAWRKKPEPLGAEDGYQGSIASDSKLRNCYPPIGKLYPTEKKNPRFFTSVSS